ncbi:hypothetical protein [Gaiella sp.]|uniref:hypothetical protein n=1 Tax=Gaiella sp. TaxID=2663207 RepID=UPI003983798E
MTSPTPLTAAPDLAEPTPGFAGSIGVARRDITPPPGIFIRVWGPATEDVSTGTHRPLTLTALALVADGQDPLVLLAADLGWWQDPADEWHVRGSVLERLGLDSARVLLSLSHTHAGPSTYRGDAGQPGGHLIPPYLDALRDAAVGAAEEALARCVEATLTWTTGRSGVAGNRDLPRDDRYVVGYNPAAHADDTLLVGRVTGADGAVIATLVNYACHPTTLAWQNTLVSPDFAGALREVVEDGTDGAPCLFLQGASGDLAPREQYVGDTAVADRHGTALGHAALGALCAMPAAGTELACLGVVESGAPLAIWGLRTVAQPRSARASHHDVPVALKDDLPTIEELEVAWADIDPLSRVERIRRARNLRASYSDDGAATHPLWVWSLGDCAIVGQPGELYSAFQERLRARFPERAVVVLNVTNAPGAVYLPPEHLYDENIYPVWQTLLARGSMERVLDAAVTDLDERAGP